MVGATRPEVVAHPLFGVLFLAQRAQSVGGHTPTLAHPEDKSWLNPDGLHYYI